MKILLILFLLAGSYGFSLYQQCKNDQECSQPNTYCYQNRVCANCINCSLYNRLPSTGCARDKLQCGECLPGLHEVKNLDNSITCVVSSEKTPNTETPEKTNYALIIPITLILLGIIITVSIVLYKRKKSLLNFCHLIKSMNTPENSRPVDPPPYTASPTAPLEEVSPPIYRTIYQHVENDPSQTANAYSNPQYVRGGDLETNAEQEEQEDSEGDALLTTTSISHPDDEETQPSNWTPTTTRSETGSITGPTTFEAAFSSNLQQLTISQPDITNQQISTYRSNSHPNVQFNSQSSSSDNSSDSNNPHVQNQIVPVNISINLNMSK